MKSLLIVGALLALLGIVTLAFPAFWTRDNKNVAQLGDVTIQNRENVLHVIPPTASIGSDRAGWRPDRGRRRLEEAEIEVSLASVARAFPRLRIDSSSTANSRSSTRLE